MDSWNSGESDAPAKEPLEASTKKRREGVPFDVICEPVGDFSKFETVVELENQFASDAFFNRPFTPAVETELDVLGHVDSAFGRNVKKYGQPEIVKIKYDVQYRGEATEVQESAEQDAIVSWTRKDNSFLTKTLKEFENSDSEEDEETKAYMSFLAKKKSEGWVTDEKLVYDEARSVIRNLHDSSISMTSYGVPNRNDFGNSAAFEKILSLEEKEMLRAREEVPQSSFEPQEYKLTGESKNSTTPCSEKLDVLPENLDGLEDKALEAWSDFVFELRESPGEPEDEKKYVSTIPKEKRRAGVVPRNDTYKGKGDLEKDETESIQHRLREMLLEKKYKAGRLGQTEKLEKWSDGTSVSQSNFPAEKGDFIGETGPAVEKSASKKMEKKSACPKSPPGNPASRSKWIPRHLRPSNCASMSGGDESGDNPSEWIWDEEAGKYKDLEL